jgi:hypothetical protein
VEIIHLSFVLLLLVLYIVKLAQEFVKIVCLHRSPSGVKLADVEHVPGVTLLQKCFLLLTSPMHVLCKLLLLLLRYHIDFSLVFLFVAFHFSDVIHVLLLLFPVHLAVSSCVFPLLLCPCVNK